MDRALKALRVIAAAILGSTALIVGVFALLRPDEAADPPVVTYLAAGWAVLTLLLRPGLVARVEADGLRRIVEGTFAAAPRSRQQPLVEAHGRDGQLFLVFQTRTLVALALPEGAALFAAIASRVDGGYLGLIAALVLLATMARDWPSPARWEAWRDLHRKLLPEDEGALAR
jgi:hypothetical protein